MTGPSRKWLHRHAPLAPVIGCDALRAHQAPALAAVWEAWEAQEGAEVEPPFWAFVWPGAAVLASWLLAHPDEVRGRRVLELGCGGGIASIAAALAGARYVVANDIDAAALATCEANAAANEVQLELDDRNLISDDGGDFGEAELILVADFFYEREAAQRCEAALRQACLRGRRVLVADAGRPFAPRARARTLLERRVPVNPDLEDVDARDVRLLALSP